MAAATPGADLTELIIDAPPELVWQTASNLEAEMPRLVRDFRSVTVSPGDEGRLVLHARGYLGQRARFDVVMGPGWCWMQVIRRRRTVTDLGIGSRGACRQTPGRGLGAAPRARSRRAVPQ